MVIDDKLKELLKPRNWARAISRNVRVCCAAIFLVWKTGTPFRALIRWKRWPGRLKYRCIGFYRRSAAADRQGPLA